MPVILKIGMIDVDLLNNGTRHPNLAQMKMSNYCKKQLNHEVHLVYKDEELTHLTDFDFLLVLFFFGIDFRHRYSPNANIVSKSIKV